ncbi:PglZ domain-containing protein [Clostridium amylolyticum]|uniref:PglZ domain-containing protein n=1 Tax=Clostridium amylolyticum TaxID=1121298 RepID=A0A1M6KE57_9CLOT|nr:PglZ domain-containing protein [Clostridium amylolyticum]SHJ57198.1 PglZ domain-containing protein [Clostridium amylolyticum]
MNGIYKDCLKRYLEEITDLESNILFLHDSTGVMDGIGDIDLYLYPHKVISVNENVLFRAKYEDIKHKKDEKYILVLKNKGLENKLLDFIKRSETARIIEIDTKSILDSIEDDVNWNEEINNFNSEDIKKRFRELLYYRKLFRKSNIEKNEVDKVVLSAFIDLDATKIKNDVDCYLYYKNLSEIYSNLQGFKYECDIKELIYKVFNENGSLIANIIKNDMFPEFENLLWICTALYEFNKLTNENVEKVLGQDLDKLSNFKEHLMELVEFAKVISKKDKILYIQKKDAAEKLIYKSGINIYESEKDYRAIIREGNGTYISVIESIKTLLKGFNLEGFKKIFKYDFNDLTELKVLIDENNNYSTENINNTKNLFNLIINVFKDIDYIEKQIKYVINSYSDWENLYKNYLYDLQYRFSKIVYLDSQNLIESNRYENIDKRISRILNEYRKRFAEFIEKNYESWENTEYGVSRPILNSDIESLLNLEDNKTFIIIFDGMRYDAWEHIVRPYFETALSERNTKYKSSYALLPSITSISREVIYSNIIKDYKNDVNYITKSESVKNEKLLKESILQDKKINVFVFNMFDRDGHKATEDFYIFYEKQRQVFEKSISELIKLIPNDANIVIASDHGLMRIDENINMKDAQYVKTVKSRYLIVDDTIKKEDCINIKDYLLPYDNKGYFLGGGEKDFYSHGGASIEEILLPFVISETKLSQRNNVNTQKISSVILAQENLVLDDNVQLKLSFKPNEKEKIILVSLYNLKNQNVSNRDIEKILKNKIGKSGLVDGIIRRLIQKLKKDGLDIIETSSAGDLIIYKLNDKGLRGEI